MHKTDRLTFSWGTVAQAGAVAEKCFRYPGKVIVHHAGAMVPYPITY